LNSNDIHRINLENVINFSISRFNIKIKLYKISGILVFDLLSWYACICWQQATLSVFMAQNIKDAQGVSKTMAYDDLYRLSAHAVITDESNQKVLLLKATYADLNWGLPGGALDPLETIHECLLRECKEELGVEVVIQQLTGVYYHAAHHSHVFIFKCTLPESQLISLSDEHSEYRYTAITELSTVQRQRVEDCLAYQGVVVSRKF
jgi:8-oxo-dGTP diphosphatase